VYFTGCSSEQSCPNTFAPQSAAHIRVAATATGRKPRIHPAPASIKLTVDTYGKWLPMGNKPAVDRLDDSAPDSKVTNPGRERAVARIAETPDIAGEEAGEPYGTRTHDPLIKS